jgi:hypothetical protein
VRCQREGPQLLLFEVGDLLVPVRAQLRILDLVMPAPAGGAARRQQLGKYTSTGPM